MIDTNANLVVDPGMALIAVAIFFLCGAGIGAFVGYVLGKQEG